MFANRLSEDPTQTEYGCNARRDISLIALSCAIIFAALVACWFGVRLAQNEVLRYEAEESARQWAVFLRQDIDDLHSLLKGQEFSSESKRVIRSATRAANIFRYKFFAADGLVTYASRPRDIGTTNEKPYFRDLVRRGHSFAKIERDEDFGALRRTVSEAYVPVMDGDNFLGAIEVYVDVTARAAMLRKLGRVTFFSLVFIIIVLSSATGVLVLRYVARLKASGELLRKNKSELIQANKNLMTAKITAECANLAKSQFLANMSHELRTPLNAVIGFSDIMNHELLGPIGNTRYREYAKDIQNAGQHLLALINDILDLSKIESGKVELHEENIDVGKAVDTSRRMLRKQAANEGVEINVELEENRHALWADNRKVKQVLVNLLSNAIKFSEPGGSVFLRTWCDADNAYVFQISDTGIGMTPEDLQIALAAFGQVDGDLNRKHEGTGLGLPLSKSLVELHDGTLDLVSQVGVGTEVTVRFPPNRTITNAPDQNRGAFEDRKFSRDAWGSA